MDFFNNKKYATTAVFLLPFPIGFLLQFLGLKIRALEMYFFQHWYPFGVMIAIFTVCLPSYLMLAMLPVFAGKRISHATIFTASLIVILPLVSLINVIVLCSDGRCSIGE